MVMTIPFHTCIDYNVFEQFIPFQTISTNLLLLDPICSKSQYERHYEVLFHLFSNIES